MTQVEQAIPTQSGVVTIKLEPLPPYMTAKRFSELVGISHGTVRGWIESGYVPTVKVGKYRLINLSALAVELRSDINYSGAL